MEIRLVSVDEDINFKLHLARLFQKFLEDDHSYIIDGGYTDWSEPIHDLKFEPLSNGNLNFYLREYRIYAAVIDGVPVGIMGWLSTQESLVWVWVEESHRLSKVATRLYHHIVEVEKPKRLNLCVRPNNKAAKRFYQSLGLMESSVIMSVTNKE